MKKIAFALGLSALALTACKKSESTEVESNVMLAEPDIKIMPDSTNNKNSASANYPQSDSGRTTVPTAANTPVTNTPPPVNAPAENAPATATK